MKQHILILLLLNSFIISAQTLTIEDCQEMAKENYPVISQKGLIETAANFTIANAKKNWLPQFSIAAHATYQSDVMTIPEEFTSMLGVTLDGLPKDQYKGAVNVEQVLYDGGAVGAQVDAAKAKKEVSVQNWEVEMYNLQERVNQVFFGALLLQKKIIEANIMIDELNRHKRLLQTYVDNGVAEQNSLDQVQVEILAALQRKSELTSNQKAYRKMLGIMINREISENTELIKPKMLIVPSNPTINRPELRYFEATEMQLSIQEKGINAMLRPQIGLFFQGAYSNLGLDLFADMQKNQWSPYFVTGVKFQWNFGALYTRKNDLAKIKTELSQVSSQRETFLYNLNLKSTQESIAIEQMLEVMKQDDEIIRLRTTIRQRAEVQIKNGAISVLDLLQEVHAENLARQNKITHEVELLKNVYDLKFTTNN